jgi:hypothetical protein
MSMFKPIAARTVIFYVARCHEDLRWYLSIHSNTRLRRAANDDGSNVYPMTSSPARNRPCMATPTPK